MKTIKVTITQRLEVPDSCQVCQTATGEVIRVGDTYVRPFIEYYQSRTLSKKEIKFVELDEEVLDQIHRFLAFEKLEILEQS